MSSPSILRVQTLLTPVIVLISRFTCWPFTPAVRAENLYGRPVLHKPVPLLRDCLAKELQDCSCAVACRLALFTNLRTRRLSLASVFLVGSCGIACI